MSSSTATLPLPAATPHLRAVRSLPSTATAAVAERWHGQQQAGPQSAPAPHPSAQHAAAPHPSAAQAPVAAPQGGQALQAPQALLAALPEGATVVAALPQGALPQGLLAQYSAQFGAAAGHPMVGYLVLVPAEAAVTPANSSAGQAVSVRPTGVAGTPGAAAAVGHIVAAPAAGPAGARPVRPAGRGITVDVERRNAYVDGRLLDLTYLEFELLAHLTEHPQRVHTRDHLVSAVWGYGHVGDGRTVDVHVARLRRKLGSAYRDSIVTVRRVGYKYTPVV
ncbi:winged helix-turn-helix domain-containing protein [Kitasatospora sp. NBC_01560]|uniref:winged helix-turn-helix domain-containing protein n=1 Tax=Kitasatospora sp. NBC_01560 TaxID=2975965 RepID=UPI00386F4933